MSARYCEHATEREAIREATPRLKEDAMKTTLDEIRTIDLHINGAMVVRTLRNTPVVMRDGVLRGPDDYADSREFDAHRQAMLAELAAAEVAVLDAAAVEVVCILGEAQEDPTLDYRTLAPCGVAMARRLGKYETYGEGCNHRLGIGNMLRALERVRNRAAAALRPIEIAMSAAIEEVNQRAPRNRENCVRDLQRATAVAADACVAVELSRVQVAIDRAVYQMMRETAQIIGIDCGEEWIARMEASL
jgi:hypothetical protein